MSPEKLNNLHPARMDIYYSHVIV